MKTILTGLGIFLTSIISAQEFRLQGRVLDFHDRSSLFRAEVHLAGKTVYTDRDGLFEMSVPAGVYSLRIEHPQCEPLVQKLDFQKDLRQDFVLEHHAQEIAMISLSQYSPRTASSTTLMRQDIDRQAGQSLAQVISQVNGVTMLSTGSTISKPVIQGLSGSRVLVIQSGIRMNDQDWGNEHAPSVDPSGFDRIRVLQGVSALKYGADAIGGMVQLEPKVYPLENQLMGRLEALGISNGGGGQFSADLVQTWKKGFYARVQGGYRKTGDYATPETTLDNTGAVQQSFQLRTGFRSFLSGAEVYYTGVWQELGLFRGAHLGSLQELYQVISLGKSFHTGDFSYTIDNPRQSVSHHLFRAEAYHRLGAWGKLSVQYAFQENHREEYDIRRGEYKRLPGMDLRLSSHQGRLEHFLEREKWEVETGFVGNFQINFPDPRTLTRRILPDYQKTDIGVYSRIEYRPAQAWTLGVAARYDYTLYDALKYYDAKDWKIFSKDFQSFYLSSSGVRVLTHPLLEYHKLSVSLSARWQKTETWDLNMDLGMVNRAPNAAEIFADGLHHSASAIEKGSLYIQPEEVYQGRVRLSRKLNKFRLEVSPHALYSPNFIVQQPTNLEYTIRGVFPIFSFRQSASWMFGVDVQVRWYLSEKLDLRTQYAWVTGRDVKANEYLVNLPPGRLQSFLEFRPWKATQIQLTHQYTQPTRLYPVRTTPVDLFKNGDLVRTNLDLIQPAEGYHLVGLNMTRDLGKGWQFYANITNLLNARYRDYLSRLRYFAPEQGRNIGVGVRVKF